MRTQGEGVPQGKDPVAIVFGEMIRTARTRANKTQRQVARETGYDAVSLSRAEAGEITPGLDTAVKIMASIGLLPIELEPLAAAAAPSIKIQKRMKPGDHRLDVLCRMMPQVFEALRALGEAADLPLTLPSPDEISRRLVRGEDAE